MGHLNKNGGDSALLYTFSAVPVKKLSSYIVQYPILRIAYPLKTQTQVNVPLQFVDFSIFLG